MILKVNGETKTVAGAPLVNALLTFDALEMAFRRVQLRRNPSCPVCGEHPAITELRDEEPAVCTLKNCCAGESC